MCNDKLIKVLFFHLCIVLITASSFGQSKNIEFDHYSPNDGLSNGYVHSIIQDSKGFLWIGTANGLNRFDGISFKTYYFDPIDSTSIPGNGATSLIEDSLGNIWVMTTSGICVYNRKKDNFSRKRFNINGIKTNNLFLNACFIDSKGFLWVAVSNSGIFRFKLYNNPGTSNSTIEAELFLLDEDDLNKININNVYSFVEDGKSKIWVASFSNKLFYFDNQQNKFIPKPINHPEAYKFSNRHKGLLKDSDGDFFIAIEGNGLLVWYREKNIFRLFKPNGTNTGPKGDVLYALAEDKNGSIWIGDRNSEGVSIFNKETGEFTYCKSDGFNPYSLSSNKITAFYRDNTGSMWVGTNIGVNKYSPFKIKFKRYFSDPNLPDKLSYNNALCFAEDKAGDIWIGTDGGGLNKLDRKTDKFIHYMHDPSNPNSLSSNAIIAICEDHEGTLWLATFNGGLARIKGNSFSAYYPDPSNPYSLSDQNIWYVYEDSKKNLWVATLNRGLELFDRKTNRFYHFTTKATDSTGLCNNSILELYEDSKQNLYITTYWGVSIIDLNKYDFSKIPPDIKFRNLFHQENKNSISSNAVYCVQEDNEGNLWFGTYGSGIDKLDGNTGKFTNYSTKDGLPGNSASSILVDDVNNLWLATDKGLAKFNPKTKEVNVFDLKDGLQNKSLKSWAMKTKDGEMFFGGPDGFNSFYPDRIKYNQNQNKPLVVITGLKIFNKPVKINEKINNRTILDSDISETGELELTYRENFFTFEFIALDYTAPEKNNYAYMMEGFDKEWINCDTKREANYTNLDPGEYTFRVKASNNDGIWNEKDTSIKIVILPPWWKTMWFRIVIVSAIILIFTSIFLSRVRQLKKQKIQLEKSVAIKTTELQQLNASKDKFFSIIAHDLKNPFNTIIGFSEILKEEIKSGDLAVIEKYAGLINASAVQTFRLLENLLEWAYSQRGKILFNPIPINLLELFNEESGVLNDMAIRKGVELKNSLPENLTITADKNMIKTILRNLISNAIKFTHRNEKVEVNARIDNKYVEISVSDNGIGMSKETMSKLFRLDGNLSTPGTENEKGTGLGLFLCKEFTEKHGGTIWAESEPGHGSIFKISLPLDIKP